MNSNGTVHPRKPEPGKPEPGKPEPHEPALGKGAVPEDTARTRRLRRVWATASLVALMAAGGIVWAIAQSGTSPVSVAGPPGSGTSPGSSPAGPSESPAPASSAVPGPASSSPAGPEAGTPETSPAPVDRSNKSEEQLAAIPQPVAAAVPLTQKKEVKSGVSAAITELQAVEGEARGIGEIAGPAIRFKVTVTNDTAGDVSLESALVNVSYGADDTPASGLSGPDPVPFPDSVKVGETVSAVYVFGVPKDARNLVKIYFNLEAATPVAAFEGQAPA